MSQRLPVVKPKELVRALLRAGFLIHHTSGSHQILKHTAKDKEHLRVTVPLHSQDLKRKTLASIVKQAGYSLDEFIDLL